ncbi:MAG TPA: Ku protein [bacterium]|nr:Ku protein [bacterium]
MRSIWSGSLSFGLVNIPVKLYSGSQESNINLNLLDKEDLSPIRYARVNKATGREVAYSQIVKGYEYGGEGNYVVLTDDDFEKANREKTKTIDIVGFTKVHEIDPIYYEKPYYLEPAAGAERPYALLRDALKQSGKVGIARFVLRNKEHIAVVRPHDNALELDQLRFYEEVRDPSGLNLPEEKEGGKEEVEMALLLISRLTKKFNAKEYADTYRKDLMEVIQEKVEGKQVVAKGAEPKPTMSKDLMTLLKASLEKEDKG